MSRTLLPLLAPPALERGTLAAARRHGEAGGAAVHGCSEKDCRNHQGSVARGSRCCETIHPSARPHLRLNNGFTTRCSLLLDRSVAYPRAPTTTLSQWRSFLGTYLQGSSGGAGGGTG